MRTDALIDRFVANVNASGGSIRRSDAIDRLPSFERRLPPSFRSLVGRYVFPAFPVGPLQLFGNTGADVDEELVREPFRSRILEEVAPSFAGSSSASSREPLDTARLGLPR